MNEFNISIDSSWDKLINSITSLLEKSLDVVNIAPVNVVYGSAYNNTFDKHIFEYNFIFTFLFLLLF